MRSALWSALLCGVGMSAAAQQRTVTFEEPSPVAITGFAVGRADYDRVSRSNTFTAGKIGVSSVPFSGKRISISGTTPSLSRPER